MISTLASNILCAREQVCFPQSKMLYAPKRLNWQSCNDAGKAVYTVCVCGWGCMLVFVHVLVLLQYTYSISEHRSICTCITFKWGHVYSIGACCTCIDFEPFCVLP